MICKGAIVKIVFRKIFHSHVSLLKDEQKDAVVHLLSSKDFVMYNFANILFGKSLILISTLQNRKEMRNGANVIVLIVLPLKGIKKEQIHVIEMEEIGIPTIVLSIVDNMLRLPIGEARYKPVFHAVKDL